MQIKKTKITEGEKHPSVGETPSVATLSFWLLM
jgi:hypothetical protein